MAKRIIGIARDMAELGLRGLERALGALTARMSGGQHAAPPAVHVPTQRDREQPDPYDVGVTTPVGTTGAAPAYNPSTAESDLQQPGTEQIMEPSTTKRIKSETDMLRRAAERNPD